MTIILVTQEAVTGGAQVRGQPRQLSDTQTKQNKKGIGGHSLLVECWPSIMQGPGFNFQNQEK